MLGKKTIDFMRLGLPFTVFSILMVLVSLGAIAVKGLNFGLDFSGGTLVELGYEEPVPLSAIREQLSQSGFERAVVVNFGAETDVLVRLPVDQSADVGQQVIAALQQQAGGPIELRRVEFVGPQVGEELREQGGLAVLLALGLVMLYVAVRFQFKFAVGAALSLLHDAIVAVGFFALFQWEFDLTVLAAVLAVIGYSLNDTIVVFDRIRENFRLIRKTDTREVVNISLTQTLGRTLATSGTTLAVLLALFFVGGEALRGFSVALIIGIGVGTYSSIYVASAILVWTKLTKEDLMPPVKEGAEVDNRP